MFSCFGFRGKTHKKFTSGADLLGGVGAGEFTPKDGVPLNTHNHHTRSLLLQNFTLSGSSRRNSQLSCASSVAESCKTLRSEEEFVKKSATTECLQTDASTGLMITDIDGCDVNTPFINGANGKKASETKVKKRKKKYSSKSLPRNATPPDFNDSISHNNRVNINNEKNRRLSELFNNNEVVSNKNEKEQITTTEPSNQTISVNCIGINSNKSKFNSDCKNLTVRDIETVNSQSTVSTPTENAKIKKTALPVTNGLQLTNGKKLTNLISPENEDTSKPPDDTGFNFRQNKSISSKIPKISSSRSSKPSTNRSLSPTDLDSYIAQNKSQENKADGVDAKEADATAPNVPNPKELKSTSENDKKKGSSKEKISVHDNNGHSENEVTETNNKNYNAVVVGSGEGKNKKENHSIRSTALETNNSSNSKKLNGTVVRGETKKSFDKPYSKYSYRGATSFPTSYTRLPIASDNKLKNAPTIDSTSSTSVNAASCNSGLGKPAEFNDQSNKPTLSLMDVTDSSIPHIDDSPEVHASGLGIDLGFKNEQIVKAEEVKPTSVSVGTKRKTCSSNLERYDNQPIKTARSSAASKTGPAAVDAAELKKLEASLSAKTSEAEELKKEAQEVRCDLTKAERGVEALTVIVHHLTQQYDAFSTPALKSELNKTKDCLQSTKIILDESQSALQAAERKLREQEERAAAQREQLTAQHSSALEQLTQQHELELQQLTARHKDELAALGEEHEGVLRRELEKHKQELETTIEEHDKKYQCLVQQLHPHAESPQSCIDPQQVLELKASHASREQELESHSAALLKEQEKLKEHSKKLQESLLSDNDHRLVAIKKYCTGLQHEVDSLKSVVEMRNSELHKLRAQVTAMEQLEKDLEAIRERNRSLVAKTEDLNAQMDAKAKAERQLMTSNRELMESMSRESSMNKQLKLEKEELEWKLQQREALSASLPPMSTLDLMTRATSAATAGSSPLDGSSANSGPRRRSQSRDTSEEPSEVNSSKASSRGADKKFITSTPLPHPHVASSKDQKNGTMSSNNYKNSACEDSSRDTCRKLELTVETNNSPPSSPSMKGVVAKSNSVSFILDLNGSLPEDSFLEFPPSPRLRPHGTPTFNRKPVQKSRSSSLEKSADQSKGVISKCSSAGNFLNKNHIPNVLHSKDKHIKSSGLDNCPERGSHSRNVSESSGGSDSMDSSVDRVSPSGLSWTVPVTSTTRDQYIDLSLRHLHAPEVDEYNSDDSDTDGMQPDITPLVNMINSSSPSDSELSRCGSQAGMVSGTEDEDSITDGEPLVKSPSPIPKPIWVPQVGAGEAMISTDLVSANCKSNNGAAINGDGKQWDPELVGSPPVLSDSDDTPQG